MGVKRSPASAKSSFWVMLAPLLVILVLLGAVFVFAAGSPLAPFIYTLF